MRSVSVVIELVGQDQLVIVAEPVEGTHRIGVVGPAFVTWNVALDRPRGAAVPRLVEILDQVRRGGGEPGVASHLGRILPGGAGVLAGGRTGARGFAAVAIVRTRVHCERDLRPVATRLLSGGEDVLDAI